MNLLLIAGIIFLYMFLLGLAGELDKRIQKREKEFWGGMRMKRDLAGAYHIEPNHSTPIN